MATGRTDIGRARTTNQDAFAVLNDSMVWIVADGMGGHPAGDLAAQTAVAVVAREAQRHVGEAGLTADGAGQCLADWLMAANRQIHEQAEARPALTGMGTTVVAMAITLDPSPTVHIAHVGDSRAYLYRRGVLVQLTRDHTLMEEYVRDGLLDAAAAKLHPQRHILTHALGMGLDVEPERTSRPLDSDDLLMLCTDGLTKMLEDEDIAAVLAAVGEDSARACDDLIEQALARGGDDNVTVIVCASASPAHIGALGIDKIISPM